MTRLRGAKVKASESFTKDLKYYGFQSFTVPTLRAALRKGLLPDRYYVYKSPYAREWDTDFAAEGLEIPSGRQDSLIVSRICADPTFVPSGDTWTRIQVESKHQDACGTAVYEKLGNLFSQRVLWRELTPQVPNFLINLTGQYWGGWCKRKGMRRPVKSNGRGIVRWLRETKIPWYYQQKVGGSVHLFVDEEFSDWLRLDVPFPRVD